MQASLSKSRKYRFPLRSGNRCAMLVDGRSFFGAMLESIAAARRYIFLEMYLVESGRVADRFVTALIEARGRGVAVYLLLDAFGSYYLHRRDRARLAAAGVHLAFYNALRLTGGRRNLFRNHRKLLLIDGEIAYTGGAGIADAFDPESDPDRYWHEGMLAIRGPCVADWHALFVETWRRWAKLPMAEIPPPAAVPLAEGFPGRVAVHGHNLAASEIMRSYLRHIAKARRRVWLATAYFIPPWKLRRALRRAARRGIDVRLLLPGPHSDHPEVRHIGSRYYERLLRDGVRIFEYQPRFIHAKALLCDNWLSIGSSNADRWNYRWNLEANQEIRSPALGETVAALFQENFSDSVEIRAADWRRRSWGRRLREWFWGALARFFLRLGDRSRGRGGPRERP